MKFFEFNKTDYDYFVKECMLNEEYSDLLKYKILGYSRVKIAQLMSISEPTLDIMTKKLKKKITKIL